MIHIDTQVHGYRQGHQLLSSSVNLSKADQSTVDQLSDVAGPLRPGEIFAPYISAYPLPGGARFVLAKTWQDLTVARAGCVRTLSLLIPSAAWATAIGMRPFFALLDSQGFPSAAVRLTLEPTEKEPLAAVPEFRANELLEALFLEEPKPVVVFDASEAELISLRLLTALWPSMRRRFALSTFALSPRKIEGRNFDLVFAPKDVRARFADWPGRRVDARTGQDARHRWTGELVARVFEEPVPRLLNEDEYDLFGSDETDIAAALRIKLLWDELRKMLERSPNAALGLLDIANSKMQPNSEPVRSLKPALVDAAYRAVQTLPAAQAWDFIGAIARKMHGGQMATELKAVAGAAAALAAQHPGGAVALMDQRDAHGAIETLVPEMADSIGRHFAPPAEQALLKAPAAVLTRLLAHDGPLAVAVAASPFLIERLSEILPTLPAQQLDATRRVLLPLMALDTQFMAAQPLLASLDEEALLTEVRHLGQTNDFEASSFVASIIARAREIDAMPALRNTLLSIPASKRRDRFLASTLAPSAEDIIWLLDERQLDASTADQLLVDLAIRADAYARHRLLSHESIAARLLSRLPLAAADFLRWAVFDHQLPLALHLNTTLRLLPVSEPAQRIELALRALDRCLAVRFEGDEVGAVSLLLDVAGDAVNLDWVFRSGLDRTVAASVVNRNLIAFQKTSDATRRRIVGAVDDLARALETRYVLELEAEAAQDCARILWDAGETDSRMLIRASGRLLPMLLRSRRAPISSMLAATFPPVYKQLAQQDEVPDWLKFVPFVDWDRCKSARKELVDAFISSPVWAPGDLALTACRSGDVARILRRAASSYGGWEYIERLTSDLSLLADSCRQQIRLAILELRSSR